MTDTANNEVPGNKARLTRLRGKLDELWKEVLAASPLVKYVMEGRVDKTLFALYMLETYQYTFHNARNQALVGVVGKDLPVHYMKFCFEHAQEETGHELMALHDIRELGIEIDEAQIPVPLMGTEVMIGYLYWVSATGNPLQRLGYSFWAESSYGYIGPIIKKVKETLGLIDSQLTFFVAHSNIDESHAQDVERMMLRFLKTEGDWRAVERVMATSLKLQARMLDDVFAEYQRIRSGESSSYSFLAS